MYTLKALLSDELITGTSGKNGFISQAKYPSKRAYATMLIPNALQHPEKCKKQDVCRPA
ncbi:hypothetical protein [Paenibacillus lactis]|uniref:hypothetical protein n=1 Tax=Paenibacillus lactis TaxID=228574 RepID=UPI001BCF9FEE|nr:hypothetical protein [Paenibacillus lactis]